MEFKRFYGPDAGGEGGPTDAREITKSDEIKTLEKILEQVKGFGEKLGEKADHAMIADLEAKVKSLGENLEELTSAQVSAQIKAINEGNEKLQRQVIELQEQAAQNIEGGSGKYNGAKGLAKAIDKAAADFAKAVFPEGKKGEKVPKFTSVEVKAAEEFGYPQTIDSGAVASAFTGRFIDPTLYQARRKSNIILDYFTIRSISVPELIYLRKLDVGADPDPEVNGGAEWIECGAAKPMRSFRLTTGTVTAKKVAVFNTIDDCLLQDVPSFMRWVREDFMAELDEAINDGLLNGNPDVDPLEPVGLKTNAVQYTPTPAFTSTVADPTYIDMIIAAAASMAASRENPRVMFVSSDVYYRLHSLKDTNARFQNNNLVYTNNLGQLYIAGVLIVQADADDIPATNFLLLGADPGFKIYAYGNRAFETGLNGQDFREDKTSVRAYQRFISFIAEDRENSVMYDTWANVEASITAPAE